MANRIAKSCRKAGCGGLSRDRHGYCPNHADLASWGSYQKENPNRIYQTKRWRYTRIKVIQRDRGLCQECLKSGRVSEGTHVDHVKPVSQGGDEWSMNNLQLLCKKCHEKKTAREK